MKPRGRIRAVLPPPPAWQRPGTAWNGGHRYVPPAIRAWQEALAGALRPVRPRRPWRRVRVRLELPDGLRGDPDNYLKTVLDGLVRAGVIADDRLAVVREAAVRAVGGRRRAVLTVARIDGGGR